VPTFYRGSFLVKTRCGSPTPVGVRGVNIPGGEKQCIATRPRPPEGPIPIVDEATSALDSDSEQAITQELGRLSRNRTT